MKRKKRPQFSKIRSPLNRKNNFKTSRYKEKNGCLLNDLTFLIKTYFNL